MTAIKAFVTKHHVSTLRHSHVLGVVLVSGPPVDEPVGRHFI
jgi:hypothetical protein